MNVDYPLEIMDDGFDDVNLKRRYSAYYCVKGELSCDKIEDNIEGIHITLRNWSIADEAYSNTGMKSPYFTIELSEVFISDNIGLLTSAMKTGREIELHYKDKNYFISRNEMNNWYLYCEEIKITQTFSSIEDLLNNATFGSDAINSVLDELVVDYIL